MELGPEGVSLLERCPHFRGWYVQAAMELEPEDVSLLERWLGVVCLHTNSVLQTATKHPGFCIALYGCDW